MGGYLLKDLKHLIFFEDLLQEANNDLVKQAKADGKRAIGYTCYFMPEVLLDLPPPQGREVAVPMALHHAVDIALRLRMPNEINFRHKSASKS